MSLVNGLIGYWGFNSNVLEIDSTSNGRTLTNANNAISAVGKIGPSAAFDGTDGLELTSEQYPDLDDILSVACWVKTTIPAEFIGTWYAGGQFVINSSNYPALDGNFGVSLFNEDGSSDNLLSTVYANDNQWHHVALTLDGSNAAFYVDGNLQDVKVFNYRPEVTKRGFFIGNVDQEFGNIWNGLLDEIGLWNRALSVDEVKTLFNSSSGITYPFVIKKGVNNFKKILGLPDYTSKVTTFDFLNLPFYIGNSKSAPVPDDGLVLYLDAGNPLSYNGGSTWTDLKSNLIFDLYNSPTFDSRFGGSLYFATSAENWAQSTTSLPSLSSWTVEMWHYYDNTNSGSCPALVTENYTGGLLNYNIGNDTTHGSDQISCGYYNEVSGSGWHSTDSLSLTPNKWYHIVGTFNGSDLKLYTNGVLNYTSTGNTDPSGSGGGGTILMRRWDHPAPSGEYWGGNLGIVRIYNKALDFTDVYKKYTSTKDRFVPPFANKIISNNTTIVNETPFASGKSYSFNGTDQFIEIGNSNDFAVGTDDFTVEWFQKMTNPTNNVNNQLIRPFSIGAYDLGNTEFAVSYEIGNLYTWTPTRVSHQIPYFNPNVNLSGSWHHIALVRSSGIITFYVDGVAIGTCDGSVAFNDGTTHLTIGSETDIHDPRTFFIGYITNFRWTKQAVYTGDFTPPTTKLRLTQNGDGGNIQPITDPSLVKVLLVP